MKYVLVFLGVFLISCQRNVRFEQYVSLASGWHKNAPVQFRYKVTDTISKHNLFLFLRNDEKYPYQNIFLITKMEFPDYKVIVDTLEYEMATPSGQWLGTGFSVKESKLYYKTEVKFPKKGTYIFSVEQADRSVGNVRGVENLQGITEVGFSVEKLK